MLEQLKDGENNPSDFMVILIFQCHSKTPGLLETVFEVTKKDQSTTPGEANDKDVGRFTFYGSLIFVPATTLVLLHMVAVVVVDT